MSIINNKTIQLAAITAGMAFAGAASADIMGWTGKGLLGFQSAAGNSSTSSLNAGVELGKTYGKWGHTVGVDAFRSSSNSERDAERYGADYKAKYNFNKHDYVFGTLGYDRDLFGGVDERFLQALGYGRRLIDLPRHTLSGEVGLGAKQEEFRDGTSNDEAVGLLNVDYNYAFSQTGNFYQNVGIETGSDNTYAESVTGVNAKLSDVLALGASYTVKHNSGIVGAEGKHSDKYTAINLTYSIK